jgi:hypothetical protein
METTTAVMAPKVDANPEIKSRYAVDFPSMDEPGFCAPPRPRLP